MTPALIDAAIADAFDVGMHQHREEIERFVKWLKLPLGHVLEIGTLHGGTSTLWGALSTGMVISIDLPMGVFGGADHNLSVGRCQLRNAQLKNRNPRFIGLLEDSHHASTVDIVASLLGEDRLDLLFIDGDHSLEGVMRDYELYKPFVKRNGVIAFHDVNDTEFHHQAGCFVDVLWNKLEGDKQVFTIDAAWGGIGVIR